MNTRSRGNLLLIVTLGVLDALTPFSIELYLPAFSRIASDLGVEPSRMSLSVSVYFIGFAIGQILYGPFLDRFGRKLPVYAGLVLYLLATLGCMTSHTFGALLGFRFASALGGSAASVAVIAMVRDYFPPEAGAKIFSSLMLVLSVSPLLAPTLGGALVAFWSWRAIFGVLTVLAAFDLALVIWVLPNVYQADPTVSLQLRSILTTFRSLLAEPDFRRYTFSGSLSFAGLFIFVAGSPTVFMDFFGASASTFGLIFAVLAGGMIGGGQLNHLLLKRSTTQQVYSATLKFQVAIGVLFLLGAITGQLGLWLTTVILFLFLVSAGITYPNAAALALAPFSKNVGSASSLLGFLQMGLGSVAAALLGFVSVKGVLPMATVMALCSGLGLLILERKTE